MRKSIIAVFVAAIAVCAVSCQKEGKYNPGKKIATIEKVVINSDGVQSTIPYETWNWDGKLLNNITYNSKTNLW